MNNKKTRLAAFGITENTLMTGIGTSPSYSATPTGAFLAISESYAKQFQDKMGEYKVGQTPESFRRLPQEDQNDILAHRQNMLLSEFNEMVVAYLHKDIVEVIDGIADIAFILGGSHYITSNMGDEQHEFEDDSAAYHHSDYCVEMYKALDEWIYASGLPDILLPELARRVGLNNLTKWDGDVTFSKSGKLLKPAGYVPVNLVDIAKHSSHWHLHTPLGD